MTSFGHRCRDRLAFARSRCARFLAARKPASLAHVRRWLDVLAVLHVVPVDPARISWRTSGGDIGSHAGRVWGNRRYLLEGDWDRRWRWPFDPEHQEGCRAVHDLVAGRPYRETREFHSRVKDRIAEGVNPRQARAEMEAYYCRLLGVLEDIRRRGYRSQADLGGDPRDEIKVYVDRDGALLIGDGGNHRLAFARLLGLPSVPVLINGVHCDFVAAHSEGTPYDFVIRGLPDVLAPAGGATATGNGGTRFPGVEAL